MRSWQKHIAHTHVELKGMAWCGAPVKDWAYVDIDHAALSAPFDRLQPCPACIKAVVASLKGTGPDIPSRRPKQPPASDEPPIGRT